jgi:hypothetical protein
MATQIANTTPPGQDPNDATAANGGIADFDYSNFYYSSSDDIFAIFDPYNEWWYGHARDNGYYLFSQPMSTPPGPRIDLEEQLGHERLKLLNLASYNYLGLSYHPEVIDAAKKALDHYGLGAAGSPILSGTMEEGRGDGIPHGIQHQRRSHSGAHAARRLGHHGPECPREHRRRRDSVEGKCSFLPP